MDYRLEQLRFELREDPSSRIFFKLGEFLRKEGELDEAIEVLRTGIKQHPRYVAAWVSLGRAQLDNGDADGAREALDRALQLDPENAVAARAMGEAAIKSAKAICYRGTRNKEVLSLVSRRSCFCVFLKNVSLSRTTRKYNCCC